MSLGKHESQKSHQHICSFYATPSQRIWLLASYYRIGLERKELCLFLTDQNPAELTAQLLHHGLDIRNAIKAGDFKILPAASTYLPEGKFSAEPMLDKLKQQIQSIKHHRLRGGGDMDWVSSSPLDATEFKKYEAGVNALVADGFSGLCLYPQHKLDTSFLKLAIRTHQAITYKGTLMPNPYYSEPELYLNPTASLRDHVEALLDRMDELSSIVTPKVLARANNVIPQIAGEKTA